MMPLTLKIEGMTCGHCLAAVEKSLTSLPGVRVDSVRLGTAALRYDPAVVDVAKVVSAIDAAGYQATPA